MNIFIYLIRAYVGQFPPKRMLLSIEIVRLSTIFGNVMFLCTQSLLLAIKLFLHQWRFVNFIVSTRLFPDEKAGDKFHKLLFQIILFV